MGWVGKTIDDHLVVVLGLHGPRTIHALCTEVISEEDWKRIYKREHESWSVPALYYGNVYPRLEKLRRDYRVVRDGTKGDYGRYRYRLPTRAEVAEARAERAEKTTVPPDLRKRVEANARAIGCDVEFVIEEQRRDVYGWIVLQTARGRVTGYGPPHGSWEGAAEEVGLL